MKMDGAEKMRMGRILFVVFLVLSVTCIPISGKGTKDIKVAAAEAEIVGDDSMEIAGGISPGLQGFVGNSYLGS